MITERRTAAAFSAVDKRKKEKALMRISVAVSATYNFVYVMPQLFKFEDVRRTRLPVHSLKCLQLFTSGYDRRDAMLRMPDWQVTYRLSLLVRGIWSKMCVLATSFFLCQTYMQARIWRCSDAMADPWSAGSGFGA